MSRLNVAILWHMHQPCYREPDSRVFRLPWVRLHGVKDYYDMPALALRYPGLKLTFNLVPVLLEQLQSYVDGSMTDLHLEVSRKKPQDLTEAEQCLLLQDFFMANWDTMIRPYPRYWDLLTRRGLHFNPSQIPKLCRRFSPQDLLDLQVWFNLTWIDPLHFEETPGLSELKKKGRLFTQEEKAWLLDQHIDILSRIIPLYQQAQGSGAIEVSTSPFYHPILPLLCDTDIAKQCMPQANLPSRFSYPQDARDQVSNALEYMEKTMATRPAGMWPSEGSVSRETVEMLSREGLAWLATDEGILAKSLGMPLRNNSSVTEPKLLYRPYRLASIGGDRSPAIFFRDRVLSDLLGFTYGSWKTDEAVKDFIGRLEGMADILGSESSDHVVPVILDGENAWEYYRDDGQDFLSKLYHGLVKSNKLVTTTFNNYLTEGHIEGILEQIYPGSWINSDYGIWIGEEEDNKAWDLVRSARQCFEQKQGELPKEVNEKTKTEIFIAEGSDWCWWYGGNYSTENLEDFDQLFRMHVSKAYQYMDLEPPEEVHIPIAKTRAYERLISRPTELIAPIIDGISTSYYEWIGAGIYDTKQLGGTMHRSQNIVKTIYYGFNLDNLFIRLDILDETLLDKIADFHIQLEFTKNKRKIMLPIKKAEPDDKGIKYRSGKIIEVQVPFALLGAEESDDISFFIALLTNSNEIERHPIRDPITIKVPGRDFSALNWQV